MPEVCGEAAKTEEEDEQIKVLAKREEQYRNLVRFARIPPKWQGITFDNSDMTLNPKALKIARQYAEGFTKQSPSLVLYSPGNGTGKTHTAICVANYVLHALRYSVLFMKARDLMLDIRRTFSDREEAEADILDKVLSPQLLNT